DTFAIDVVAVDDHIAKIDADSVGNALCFGAVRFGARRRLLDRQCAVDGRNHAAEFDECTVAHELDDASTVGTNAGIEDLAAVELEPFERPGLVGLHEAAIAGDVGREYRGQSALHRSAFKRGFATLLTPRLRLPVGISVASVR